MSKPSELGIVVKGDAWRNGQYAAAEAIANSPKKIIVVEGETGAGKSAVALAVHHLTHSHFTVVLTATYDLQQQYKDSSTRGRDVYGRPKFNCALENYVNLTADIAPCSGGYPCKQPCPYVEQRVDPKDSLIFTNYAYWLQVRRETKQPSLLICDEAHVMEGFLVSFRTLDLLNYGLGGLTDEDAIREALKNKAKAMDAEANELDRKLRTGVSQPGEFLGMRAPRRLHQLAQAAELVADDHWVRQGTVLRPVWGSLSDLKNASAKMIIMSATPPPLSTLGLKEADVERIVVPSSWNRKTRAPVYYRPAATLNRKNLDEKLPVVIEAMDRFIADHPGQRGLIHTHKYTIAKSVMEHSRFRHEIVWHAQGHGARKEALRLLKEGERRILASPVMTTGVDLLYDQCRFIVWLKVPWADLNDPVVKARVKEQPKWYPEQTGMTLVQGAGRGFRAPDDACDVLILDGSFGRIWKEGNLPTWFKNSVVWESSDSSTLTRRGSAGTNSQRTAP